MNPIVQKLTCKRCGAQQFEELIEGDAGSISVALVSLFADSKLELNIETLRRWRPVEEDEDVGFRCAECGHNAGNDPTFYGSALFDELEPEVHPAWLP